MYVWLKFKANYNQDTSFPAKVFAKGSYFPSLTIFAQIVQQMFDGKSKSLNTTPQFLENIHELFECV